MKQYCHSLKAVYPPLFAFKFNFSTDRDCWCPFSTTEVKETVENGQLFPKQKDLNSGSPNTNPSSGRNEDLIPGLKNYRSSPLITRPREPPLFVPRAGKRV